MQAPTPSDRKDQQIADAKMNNWVDRLAPIAWRPYLRMARIDRPIGYWLLFWPCAMSLALASLAAPQNRFSLWSLALFFIGAVVMRGAGCTLNDIIDRDLDQQVARTRSRPIPSGQVSVQNALIFMAVQCLIGLLVLLQFNDFTKILGLSSVALIIIYPFMKRITYWPQLFLGLVFNWGALMGWAAVFGTLNAPALWLYAGAVFWTIGYDTLYALQDKEDDALIGIKSTARLFGAHVREITGLFYALTVLFWAIAAYLTGASFVFYICALGVALNLLWQILTLNPAHGPNCHARFKANHWVGVALTLALIVDFIV